MGFTTSPTPRQTRGACKGKHVATTHWHPKPCSGFLPMRPLLDRYLQTPENDAIPAGSPHAFWVVWKCPEALFGTSWRRPWPQDLNVASGEPFST